jgi:hypothetical protein
MGGEREVGTDEDVERERLKRERPGQSSGQSSILASSNSARLAFLGQVTYSDADGVCRAQTPMTFLSANESRLPPQETEADRWRHVIGEESTAFDHIAHVCVPKGVRVRLAPDVGAGDAGIIPFDTRVKIERKTKFGWCYVTVLPQQAGAGSSDLVGATGFVEGRFLLLDPPDAGSFLHMVKPGEGAASVAARYFKPPEGFTTGYDAWLFVSALYEANKHGLHTAEGTYPSAIERKEVSLGRTKTLLRWESEEESMRIYLGARLKEGHALWIPSLDKVFEMKAAGTITSAAILSKEGYAGGFTRGVIDGIADGVKDLYEDAKAIAQLLFEIFFEDKLFDKLNDLAKKIGHAIAGFDASKVAAAGKQMLIDFVDKWTHPDEFYRGHFIGHTIGYLLVLVLPMLLSAGASALARAPRAARILRILAAIMDPGELVSDLTKGMRGAGLTEEALSSRFAREGVDVTPMHGTSEVAKAKQASELFYEGMDPQHIKGMRIKPGNLRRELMKSQTGRETLEIIEKQNVEVILNYNRDMVLEAPGQVLYGVAYDNVAVVYIYRTQSVELTAQTVIHEVTHVAGIKGSQRAEIIAEIRAMQHVGAVSQADIKAIILRIKRDYPELPYRILPPRSGAY